MKNHKTEILSKTSHGYTLWCCCCHDIQLGFGNMLLIHSTKTFFEFKKYIDSIHNDSIFFQSHLNKPIYLKMGYCLSKEELIELKELLANTIIMIKLQEILQETLS